MLILKVFCEGLVVLVVVVSEGPGLFGKVRGTGRTHFQRVSSKSDHGRSRNDEINCQIRNPRKTVIDYKRQ